MREISFILILLLLIPSVYSEDVIIINKTGTVINRTEINESVLDRFAKYPWGEKIQGTIGVIIDLASWTGAFINSISPPGTPEYFGYIVTCLIFVAMLVSFLLGIAKIGKSFFKYLILILAVVMVAWLIVAVIK